MVIVPPIEQLTTSSTLHQTQHALALVVVSRSIRYAGTAPSCTSSSTLRRDDDSSCIANLFKANKVNVNWLEYQKFQKEII